MHFSLLLALPLLSVAQETTTPVQNATQLAELAFLANFLAEDGESSFVNATDRVLGSQAGNEYVLDLASIVTSNESATILVPNNDAFAQSPPKNITDLNTLGAILTYHVVKGRYTTDNIASFPNYILARTLMNTSQLVKLEGGEGQVLAITNDNGTIKIISQNKPVQALRPITLPSNVTNSNLQGYVLDAVLEPPPSIADALALGGLKALQGAVQQTSLLKSLEASQGQTIFAPSDMAFASLASANNVDLSNLTALGAIIGNHVINGSTLYSPQFPSNAITALGEPLTFTKNSSGVFVSSGSSTAKVIQPDVLISNGVVHVIDNVLLNVATDPTAASSALASASSAAATAASVEATQTSPVGSSGPSGLGSSSSSSPGNTTTPNGNNGSNGAHKASFGYITSIFLSILAGCLITR